MKITVEVDRNIMKDGKPDMATYVFDEPVEDFSELLDLYRRIAISLGYSCGELMENDDEF